MLRHRNKQLQNYPDRRNQSISSIRRKIESIICQGLIPQLDFPLERCTAIYFYGAGCLPPKTESIIHVLQNNFPEADISVDTDLLGAARALCKDNAGIACILGTGSNSCLYDGKRIIQNISPLGYILGDEGSGAYLGKRFISDCLKRTVAGKYLRKWIIGKTQSYCS